MFFILDLFGVVVFAMTGCLIAARHRLDLIGFVWLSVITAVGGGTVRDLILDLPVFWLEQPVYLYLCLGTACFMYFMAHWIHRHLPLLLWCDALGLAVFAVIGTRVALDAAAFPLVAILMGVLTATFGGILRDLLAGESSFIMRREIYVTAAVFSSLTYLAGSILALPEEANTLLAVGVGFGLRALALRYRMMLPGHRWLGLDQDNLPNPNRRREK